jgi:putative ABC transport system substrate-binding protein
MRRREFITLLGGATAWSQVSRAQQPAIPVIGFLSSVPFETRRDQVAAFHRGLKESGYVEGQNVAIEYLTADNHTDRMPALAADLVNRRVTIIVTIGGDSSAQAAKAATTTIPVVFVSGTDVAKNGLVASLNRPGGNVTGVSFLVSLTSAKRLQLLSELAPHIATIGMLVNPSNPNTEPSVEDAQEATKTLGKKLVIVKASTARDLDTAFATFVQEKVQAAVVEADPVLLAMRERVVSLAAVHALPAVYAFREFAAVGGLMSYGSSLSDAYRQAGAYAGKILNGEKPADLPVMQSTKFDLVINLKAAKALGLTIPDKVLALADEVIE